MAKKQTGYQSSMSESNQQKSIAGSEFDARIKLELQDLKNSGAIIDYQFKVNSGHPGFAGRDNYLANYIITTPDHKYISVRSSTSYKQDRIKTILYDLDGISRFSIYAGKLIANMIVFDNPQIAKSGFRNMREKIITGKFYSPATHIFVFDEFVEFLKEYKYVTLDKIDNEQEPSTSVADALVVNEPSGSAYGKAGNKLENVIVDKLSDYQNLKDLKKGRLDKTSIYSLIMTKILAEHTVNIEEVVNVSANNAIPMLNRGGSPKTDVMVVVTYGNGTSIVETISAKNTKVKSVSCHDYRVEDFIRVLKCEGTKLEHYLIEFQKAGAKDKFVANLSGNFSEERFIAELAKVKKKLCEWALTGAHDHANLVNEKIQVSRYIFMRQNEELRFCSMSEYLDQLFSINGMFDLPFGWTYPSKQRGRRIQLKVPIIIK
jgi:hypothetical protein